MANQILAGAVINAGMVIAGVDADNPPYVGPPVESLVSLYLNGTTSGMSDASENSHTLTTHGDVSVLPTSPYNTSGSVGNYLSFPTSGDYLNVPQNNAFNFDGGDFTVEFFMNLDGTNHGPHPNNPVIIGGRYGWYIQLKNNDSRITFYDNLAEHHADVTIDIDSWNHVAVTREGDTIRTFLNGVEVYSGSTNRDAQLSGSNLFIGIGARLDSNLAFNGSLSDIRIVKGTALYTSGFTVPTSALTEVSGTSLLLSGDSLTDESSYGHTVNVSGYVTSNTGTPRSTTRHSMTFDGNGDYISVADHDEFDFGTEDFTVEMWMNADTQSANFPSLFSSSDYNSTGSSSFRFDNVGYDGKLFLYTNGLGDPALSTTNTLSLNAWNHIALVRNGTSLSFYVNGSEDGTITISDSQTFDFSVGEFRTGRGFDVDGGNAYFNGEIADLRAVKGKAVYSSNFSTPTLPVGDYSVLLPPVIDAGYIVTAAFRNQDNGPFSGSVYVYDGNGENEVKILSSDNVAYQMFGYQVDTNGSKVVVAAKDDSNSNGTKAGSVYVYDMDGTNEVKLLANGSSGNTKVGWKITCSENKVAASAFGSTTVWIWNLDGSGQTQISTPVFRGELAMSDNTLIVVGQDYQNANGDARAFRYDINTGQLLGTHDNIESPFKVDANGSKYVISSHNDTVNGVTAAGQIYVYDMDGSNEIVISASDASTDQVFGHDVAISDTKIAAITYRDPSPDNLAAVYVYDLDGSNEVKITPSNALVGTEMPFGYTVELSGTKVIVGDQNDDTEANNAGALFIYNLDGTGEQIITTTDADEYDYVGLSLGASG